MLTTPRIYGFKSCDLVRAALKWMDAGHVAYAFVDYRKEPLDRAVVQDWFARAGWEVVFNRNATTFKALPEEARNALNEQRALAMILEQTNFIKRPVLDTGSSLVFGFNEATWRDALALRS